MLEEVCMWLLFVVVVGYCCRYWACAMSSSVTAAGQALSCVPSSPRSCSPPVVVPSFDCPPNFPCVSPFSDPSLISQLELFSNYPLPASFLCSMPLPEWQDLGFPLSGEYSLCVLANLCLLEPWRGCWASFSSLHSQGSSFPTLFLESCS